MVDIIGRNERRWEVECGNCHSILSFAVYEVQRRLYPDYGGGCEVGHHIMCPGCDTRVDVDGVKGKIW